MKGRDVPYNNGVKYDYNVAWGKATKKNTRRRSWIARGAVAVAAFSIGAVIVSSIPEKKSRTPGQQQVAISLPGSNNQSTNETDGAQNTNTLNLDLENTSEQTDPNTRLPFEPQVPQTTNATSEVPVAQPLTVNIEDVWRELLVAPGDNLSLMFSRENLSKKDLHAFLQLGGEATNLKRIKPEQIIRVRADGDGHILELIHEVDYLSSLHIYIENDRYTAELIEVEPEIRTRAALATIDHSLFLAGQKADLSDRTIMALTDIFGWDVDFALDIREGDRFSVIFEEIYKDDVKVREGKILAAEFINQNRELRAVYYENDDGHEGYYSDDGKAMQKAFLRTPVNFSRISSKFNLKRRHPVLNRIRAHKGVDYAAPHGTPIRATANGKIQFIGTKGGYGKTLIMQHGDSYSTLYAHMSRFASAIKRGKRIEQGQTIGYVGKTGLATGPHLHYEFRINGEHRNPLTVALPSALPIEKKYLDDFKKKSAPLLAELEALEAQAQDNLIAHFDFGNTETKSVQ